MRRIRRLAPSPAMVVACLALAAPGGAIIARSGGTSPRHAGNGYYVLDFGASVQGHLIYASYSRSSDDRGGPGELRAGPCTTATNEGDNCATGNDPRVVAGN